MQEKAIFMVEYTHLLQLNQELEVQELMEEVEQVVYKVLLLVFLYILDLLMQEILLLELVEEDLAPL